MSGTGGVRVGTCALMLQEMCDATPVGSPILVCNISGIATSTRFETVNPISVDGGAPGTRCLYIDLPDKKLPSQVDINTCTGIDPGLEALLGEYDVQSYIPPHLVAADPTFDQAIGMFMQELKPGSGANACGVCACGAEGTSCKRRLAVTRWSNFYCFGEDNTLHPAGRYWIDHWGALEYQPTANTVNFGSEAEDGRTLSFYAYSNPGWEANIIPQSVVDANPDIDSTSIIPKPIRDAGTVDPNAVYFGFTSTICPPGQCGCGGDCGSEALVGDALWSHLVPTPGASPQAAPDGDFVLAN